VEDTRRNLQAGHSLSIIKVIIRVSIRLPCGLGIRVDAAVAFVYKSIMMFLTRTGRG
jgi:hypothetical protein